MVPAAAAAARTPLLCGGPGGLHPADRHHRRRRGGRGRPVRAGSHQHPVQHRACHRDAPPAGDQPAAAAGHPDGRLHAARGLRGSAHVVSAEHGRGAARGGAHHAAGAARHADADGAGSEAARHPHRRQAAGAHPDPAAAADGGDDSGAADDTTAHRRPHQRLSDDGGRAARAGGDAAPAGGRTGGDADADPAAAAHQAGDAAGGACRQHARGAGRTRDYESGGRARRGTHVHARGGVDPSDTGAVCGAGAAARDGAGHCYAPVRAHPLSDVHGASDGAAAGDQHAGHDLTGPPDTGGAGDSNPDAAQHTVRHRAAAGSSGHQYGVQHAATGGDGARPQGGGDAHPGGAAACDAGGGAHPGGAEDRHRHTGVSEHRRRRQIGWSRRRQSSQPQCWGLRWKQRQPQLLAQPQACCNICIRKLFKESDQLGHLSPYFRGY